MADKRPEKKRIWRLAGMTVILLILVLIFSVKITEITVDGNKRYSDEQVVEILFPEQKDRNTVYCYLKDMFQEHEQIPFIQDYKIVFRGPAKAEIIIYEKSVVGYVDYMSSYMYFDKDGIIVESANRKLSGVPWITGLKFGQVVLYQPLPVESERIFEEILNLTQILSVYKMAVDEIRYDSHGEARLYMGGLEIVLGSNDSLNGKIAELNDMLPKLEGRNGILYLDNYDETNTAALYSFEPRK